MSSALKSVSHYNKAVLYARVSSKEQEQEGYSIPAQLKLLRDEARKRELEIAREFIDAETAKQSGRTGFNEMLAYLQENPSVRYLFCEKTDRLSRNFRDIATLDDLMSGRELVIILVKENTELSRNSRSHEKFIFGIKALMSKNYIDNLCEETRKGMQEKAEQGIFPSRAPMGYLNVQCGDKRFIQPDPALAPHVRKLFEWYATGNYSLLDITRMARAEGLGYRKSGAKIQKSVIASILHNPIYCGEFLWRGKLYPGTHEPIITKELLNEVQGVFDQRDGKRTRKSKYLWAFQGLVSCGHCGCALVAERKKSRYTYYHCTGHKGRCGEKYVKEDDLARQFGEALLAIQLDPEVLSWLKEALHASMNDERDYHTEAIQKLQQNYQRLQERLDALYVDKLDRKVDETTYLRLSERWRGEQEDLRRTLERHEKANHSYVDAGVQLLELSSKAHSLYEQQPMLERRRLLNYAFSNCSWKGGRLAVTFRQPFDILADTNLAYQKKKAANGSVNGLSEIWLPGQDSNLRPSGYGLTPVSRRVGLSLCPSVNNRRLRAAGVKSLHLPLSRKLSGRC